MKFLGILWLVFWSAILLGGPTGLFYWLSLKTRWGRAEDAARRLGRRFR